MKCISLRKIEINYSIMQKELPNGVKIISHDANISSTIDDLSLEELRGLIQSLNRKLQDAQMQRDALEYELEWNETY